MKHFVALLLVSFVTAGVAHAADSIHFEQNGAAVMSVAVGSAYQITAHVHLKNAPMFLCLEELPQNVCYPVTTDGQGDFGLPSSTDACNFELHEEYVGGPTPTTTIVCDVVPKMATFMIVRPGTAKPILATADLTFE